MKYTMLLGSLCVLMLIGVSCTKGDIGTDDKISSYKDMVILAIQENDNTKTSVDGETGSVYWNPGDAINVFNGEIGLKFVSQNNAKAKVASFVNSYSVIIGSNEGENIVGDGLFGLYPYDPNATSDGVSVSTTLPDSQMAVAGTFADNLFITLGKTEGTKPEMGFYNVCGGIRFKVSEEGIRAIRLKGNNGEFLAGKVKIKFDEFGCPTVSEVVDGKSEVSLECPDGFVPGEWYYLVTLPVALNKGYTVTFLKGSDGADFVSDSSTEIKRSVFGSLEQKDEGLEWSFREAYIPDSEFNSYCLSNFDADGDGTLSQYEIEAVTEMDIYDYKIVSLEGIELFKNLTSLIYWGDFHYEYGQVIPDGTLTYVDLRQNLKLERIELLCNQITYLDLRENKNLSYVDCSYNELTEILVPGLTKLEFLDCGRNQLTSLDVSQNTALTIFGCYNNQLTSLDISNNTELIEFTCDNNQLTSLDVSNNTALRYLYCYNNPNLTELWLGMGQTIQYLSYDSNVTELKYKSE